MSLKVATLVIGHNEGESLPAMREALLPLTADRYWVLDRCVDNSEEVLKDEENVIVNTEGHGFLAGRMRDLGLDQILQKDYDVVIFLDGDRIPTGLTDEEIEKCMSLFDVAYMKLGTGDFRDKKEKNGALPYTKSELKVNGCITAGVMVRRRFLDRIRQISYMKGRCFHPDLDGAWGCEDFVLGVMIYACCGKFGYSAVTLQGQLDPTKEWTDSYNGQWHKAHHIIKGILGDLWLPSYEGF